MKILVVDDDSHIMELLTFVLGREGFTVLPSQDTPSALRLLQAEEPSLVVLDVNLGAWDGFDLLKTLRQRSRVPVLMLTGRDREDDKIRGLELGADDYLTKPFSYRELVARIQALLRRAGWEPTAATARGPLTVGPLTLNPAEHRATRDGQPLDLTATEFRLLHYLMTRVGNVVPTRVLLKEVWGYDDAGGTDIVRVTLYRLRRKLEEDPANPRLLHTVAGVGVMLKPETAG